MADSGEKGTRDVGRAVGYVVLTDQPDGSWKDDWDGEVHVTTEDALTALNEARQSLGREGVMLVSLHVAVEPDGIGRCPTCDSALADPKSGWSVAAPECSDPWHATALDAPHERLVYVCDGCGAEHPQLWDLQHADDCPPTTAWHVEGRADSGRKDPDHG